MDDRVHQTAGRLLFDGLSQVIPDSVIEQANSLRV